MSVKEEFDKLASVMDKRELVYKAVKNIEDKGGIIPPNYFNDEKFMTAYTEWKHYGTWRNDKVAYQTIAMAAKRMAKNGRKKS